MSTNVEDLHKQITEMPLGDLLLLAGQAVNMGMEKEKVDLILRYVELKIGARKLKTLYRK